jgi:hypothetical protein
LYLGILENPAAGDSDSMWGLIDARHQAVFVDQSSGAIYRLSSLTIAGGAFKGTFLCYTPSSAPFAGTPLGGGASVSSGTVQSSFSSQASLTGYLASSSASLPVYSFDDSYQSSLYNLAASLSTIAGTYTFSSGSISVTLNITISGSFTLAYNSCSGKGAFSIPDPNHNAYELSGSLTCSGATSAITGLASFTPASGSTAAQLTLEYDDGSSLAVEAVAKQ